MPKRILAAIILFFLVAMPVMPVFAIQEGDEVSLEDCVEIAIQNDPNIRISTSYAGIDKARIKQAQSDYFPTLGAGAGYNIQNNRTSGMGTNSNDYGQINLGVNQLIWNFGKTVARINMAKYNYKAGGFSHQNTILNTVYRVKTAYFTVLAASANEDVYERAVRINELHFERAKALFEEGLISKIDVVNAEVYLTDAKIQLISAQNRYKTAIIELNNAMFLVDAPEYTIKNTESFNFQRRKNIEDASEDSGLKKVSYVSGDGNEDGDETAILTSGIEKDDILQDFIFTPYSTSLADSIELAYQNRPDLQSLILVQSASEESLKVVKRTFMPELGASGGYNYRNYESGPNTNSLSAGLNLNFNSNLMDTKYRVDEAKGYLDIAVDNVDLFRKNVYFEVQKNYSDMLELEKRVPLMKQRVSQTLENFELADGRYTVGMGNFIELQDAQTNYNKAQLAYVQAVFDYNVAKVLLERSMGVR